MEDLLFQLVNMSRFHKKHEANNGTYGSGHSNFGV